MDPLEARRPSTMAENRRFMNLFNSRYILFQRKVLPAGLQGFFQKFADLFNKIVL